MAKKTAEDLARLEDMAVAVKAAIAALNAAVRAADQAGLRIVISTTAGTPPNFSITKMILDFNQ